LSRNATTRSVDAELAVGVTLHMHLALSERGKTAPASGDEQVRRGMRVETRIRAGAGIAGRYGFVIAYVRYGQRSAGPATSKP
jgi:hypothetical protein